MKKIVDERQELELMKVERLGFWVLYDAVAVDILVKVLFLGTSPKAMLGENIAFVLGSLVIIIGCCRRGLWNYHSRPTLKSHLLYSLAGTLIFSLLFYVSKRKILGESALTASLIFALSIFLLMFFVLFMFGEISKRRAKKLTENYDDDLE